MGVVVSEVMGMMLQVRNCIIHEGLRLIQQVTHYLERLVHFFISLNHLGNVYIADGSDNRIRKVTVSTGIITTIAGTGSELVSYSGDNGPATSATLYFPFGVTVDSAGTHSLIYFFVFSLAY